MERTRYDSTTEFTSWWAAVTLAAALIVLGPLASQELRAEKVGPSSRESVFAPFTPPDDFVTRMQGMALALGVETAYDEFDGSGDAGYENVHYVLNPIQMTPTGISNSGSVAIVSDTGTLTGDFGSTISNAGAVSTLSLEEVGGDQAWYISVETSSDGADFVGSVVFFDGTGASQSGGFDGTLGLDGSLVVNASAEVEAMLAPLAPYFTLGQRSFGLAVGVVAVVCIIVAVGVCIAGGLLGWFTCDASQKMKLQHEEERLCLQRFPTSDAWPCVFAA